MTINLPPDLERFVAQAVTSGSFGSPDDVVREALSLLRQQTEEPTPSAESQSATGISEEEWKARLRHWIASHPPRPYFVDVSRELIYSGRGE